MTTPVRWEPIGIIPTQATDGAVEALACIYLGRVCGLDADDLVLGEHEHAAVLVAQAEVALVVATGAWPRLIFEGPPLAIAVQPHPTPPRHEHP